MEKKPVILNLLVFLAGLLGVALLVFLSYQNYSHLNTTEHQLDQLQTSFEKTQTEIEDALLLYTSAADARTGTTETAQGTDKEAQITDGSGSSVFNTAETEGGSASSGHIVGVDPGHQSSSIDMSAQEAIGPGATQTKARSTTGTQGTYSGLAEYQLNLDVSLLLRDILLERGYTVIMTRTDNDTAISNQERAQLMTDQGAEIWIRIHANGSDDTETSGALALAPSASNPYVAELYESSSVLSQCVLNAYCSATGLANLGIQYNDEMTGINWSTIPVTILEMGFMTNQNDDLLMSDSSFQSIMAQGIADGIDDYFSLQEENQ